MNEEITIRKGVHDDMPAVLGLVQELARFEKAPREVTAGVKDYEKNLAEGVFEVIVAEKKGDIIGMALYFLCWSTWKGRMIYLDDFIVTERQRNKGIGQLLFDAVIEDARKKNCTLVKWQVLDWNKPAVKFYEKNRATIEKEWWNGKIFLKNV